MFKILLISSLVFGMSFSLLADEPLQRTLSAATVHDMLNKLDESSNATTNIWTSRSKSIDSAKNCKSGAFFPSLDQQEHLQFIKRFEVPGDERYYWMIGTSDSDGLDKYHGNLTIVRKETLNSSPCITWSERLDEHSIMKGPIEQNGFDHPSHATIVDYSVPVMAITLNCFNVGKDRCNDASDIKDRDHGTVYFVNLSNPKKPIVQNPLGWQPVRAILTHDDGSEEIKNIEEPDFFTMTKLNGRWYAALGDTNGTGWQSVRHNKLFVYDMGPNVNVNDIASSLPKGLAGEPNYAMTNWMQTGSVNKVQGCEYVKTTHRGDLSASEQAERTYLLCTQGDRQPTWNDFYGKAVNPSNVLVYPEIGANKVYFIDHDNSSPNGKVSFEETDDYNYCMFNAAGNFYIKDGKLQVDCTGWYWNDKLWWYHSELD
ncbi:MAG: hypothetical protein AB3N28_15085 [Kordiimonas sp.]